MCMLHPTPSTTAPDPSAAERKTDHVRIAAQPGVEHLSGTGLDRVRLRHRALPERDLADVRLGCELLGRPVRAPLVVSAMTGGTGQAESLNARLMRAAADHGIALTLGSGRPLLDDPDLLSTYVRAGHPRPPLLIANLGAAQVRRRDAADRARRLVDLLGADALSIHLNPVQEAVQPEGQPEFAGVADAIARLVAALRPLPVVVKEVGFGLDPQDVALLRDAGVAAIDVAGSGGTNWAVIEGRRDARAGAVAAAFADWGVPTARALCDAVRIAPELPIVASGGLRDGVDAAKCLALGAVAAGVARPLLIAATQDEAGAAVETLLEQLRVATWAVGAASTSDLGTEHLA